MEDLKAAGVSCACRLRFDRQAGHSSAPSRHGKRRLKTPKRVVILEDSPSIRERVTDAIAATGGCTVVGYSQSEFEAIALIDELAPDLVIADMQLHQGSGLGVLRHIRAQAREPRPTVVMLTNFSSDEFYERSMKAGADAFFDKTADYDRFLDFIGAIG